MPLDIIFKKFSLFLLNPYSLDFYLKYIIITNVIFFIENKIIIYYEYIINIKSIRIGRMTNTINSKINNWILLLIL